MRSIEQLLGDLLLRHNCVIVPSFGGFVAKQVSAKIDYSSGKMFPPSKSLLFNKQLINNDGLLISEFSQSNGLSYEEATQKVQAKVSEWQKILSSGSRIELDRIGYLFFDAEKNLCFEQDRFFNLLLESFGLGQVHFLTEEDVKIVERLHQIDPVEKVPAISIEKEKTIDKQPVVLAVVEEPLEKETTGAPVIAHPEKRRIWRYVAAACILPIAFYSIWIPMKTDVLESGVISINDFNPFHTQADGSYEMVDLDEISVDEESEATLEEQIEELEPGHDAYTYAYDETVNVSVALEGEEAAPTDEHVSEEPVNDETFEANAMHYVVGCFGDKSNATNLVAKLKAEGMEAKIVDYHNGLHRVSAGTAISLEAFAKVKVTANNLGYTGWTLK
jgi:cell division septation protein DedD